jgi:predicted RND superfamily exporter protein
MKSIAFGIERIAWPAMRWPLATGVVVLAVLALSAWGITRLAFDENLRGVFASDTPSFAAYQRATSDFVDPENETLVLVEGDIGKPENLARLQDLQFELQFIDGIGSVYSLFGLRQAPPEAGAEAPLLVRSTADGLTPALIEGIRAHPLLGAKLLSADGKAMVYVVTAAESKAPLSVARKLKASIDQTAAKVLAGTGLTVTVTGFPTLRATIVDIIRRDQIVLNAVGAVVGCLMSLVAFRSVVAAVMTAIPGIAAGVTVLGVMGLFGLPVTVLSNVIPALVMILGYADAMHLSHVWRHHRDRGLAPAEAEREAQKEVAAACILTSIIVAGAFLSLALTDIGLVRGFALLGTVAMLIGGIVVLVVHALAARLLGPLWVVNRGGARDLFTAMEGPSAAVAARVVALARPIALAACVAFVGFGAMYLAVPAEHSVRENLPASDPANAALGRFDAKFGGAFPIEVLVPLDGVAPTSPAGLARIGAIHKAVAAVPGTATPISLWSMVEWLGGTPDAATAARLSAILEQADPATLSRLYSKAGTALITVSVREEPTRVTAAIVDRVETAAAAANGGRPLTVTGVTVLTAREATRTIATLNGSLATAVIGDTILMVLAFRNLPIGILSIIANTLPLFAVGSLLFVLGKGLQLTIVVALTVAFGIAVDDTIHYLNRFLVLGNDTERVGERLVRTSREVGPVLIGSTAIVLTGLSTTLTSGLPTVSLFGMIAAVTLVVAMIGDLIVMPALIAGVAKRWFEPKRKLALGEAAATDPHA